MQRIREDIKIVMKTVERLSKLPDSNRIAIANEALARFRMPKDRLQKCMLIGKDKSLRKEFIEQALKDVAFSVNKSVFHPLDRHRMVCLFELFRYWMIECEPRHVAYFLEHQCQISRKDSVKVSHICSWILSGHNKRTGLKSLGISPDRIDIWFDRAKSKIRRPQ